MLDISTINKRYFDITLAVTDDNDKEHKIKLEVGPPKVKVLRKMTHIKSAGDDAIDELADAIRKILSNNRSKFKVPQEYIDELDFEEIQGIFSAYMEWVAKNRNDPN